MESVNELEKKLSIAREIEKIKNIFNNAQCPVCGCTGIEVKITISGAESMIHGYAVVKCKHCEIFNYERKINGYDAYHWNYNGSSELSMLQELLDKVRPYLKIKEETKCQ